MKICTLEKILDIILVLCASFNICVIFGSYGLAIEVSTPTLAGRKMVIDWLKRKLGRKVKWLDCKLHTNEPLLRSLPERQD